MAFSDRRKCDPKVDEKLKRNNLGDHKTGNYHGYKLQLFRRQPVGSVSINIHYPSSFAVSSHILVTVTPWFTPNAKPVGLYNEL